MTLTQAIERALDALEYRIIATPSSHLTQLELDKKAHKILLKFEIETMNTTELLKAAGWEFRPSIDNGFGIAQPEYWTHEDHNGTFTEEEALQLLGEPE